MWRWDIIFFAANLTAGLAWVVVSALFVREGSWVSSSAAIVTGLAMASPGIALGIAECVLFSRRHPRTERRLGVVAGLVGALALYSFVSELVRFADADIRWWVVFGAICFSIAAYGFWCCWLRVRHRSFPDRRGFPVGPAAAP